MQLDAAGLAAYLARIGIDAAPGGSVDAVSSVARAHAQSIPFENLDAFVGRRVSLQLDEVLGKLVHARRGGWCFEQNLLLGSALRALGFEVTDLAGRVLWGRDEKAVTPRTHRALLVRADGRNWLADVGFGGQGITGVLDLEDTGPQQVGHDRFRLTSLDGDRLLSVQIRGEWLPMYRFDLQPQWPIDFEAANFQLCVDPASHFTQSLMLSRADPRGRHALRGLELAFHEGGARSTRRVLSGAEELLGVLRDVFGLVPDEGLAQALRARVERLRASSGTRA